MQPENRVYADRGRNKSHPERSRVYRMTTTRNCTAMLRVDVQVTYSCFITHILEVYTAVVARALIIQIILVVEDKITLLAYILIF